MHMKVSKICMQNHSCTLKYHRKVLLYNFCCLLFWLHWDHCKSNESELQFCSNFLELSFLSSVLGLLFSVKLFKWSILYSYGKNYYTSVHNHLSFSNLAVFVVYVGKTTYLNACPFTNKFISYKFISFYLEITTIINLAFIIYFDFTWKFSVK